ncbi:endopeptidase La [Buchnera aphidicola]|uniref:Lon protease n=1 Tax=Buchnera aphidicola (Sarucallis kahawaluokalani) TaxID=1241878 RepID=A0A4D6YM61_9GAMM|nr:endopeptidase La [Buchnera aphidicola]QCI26095.1 endopeptidase La [Buchnera aphidicola (Sarucallis kahawaluokalani)]
MNSECSKNIVLPILPLRDIVIYPNIIIPLFVGRKKSIKCIKFSMKNDKKIILVTQKISKIENPNSDELFKIGTIATILQIFKLPDGTIKILVKGLERGKINKIYNDNKFLTAETEIIHSYETNKKDITICMKMAVEKFEKYLKFNKNIPIEILKSLYDIHNSSKLSDIISSHITLKLYDQQKILEMLNINTRLEYLIQTMISEINLFKLEKKIRHRIQNNIERNQKEYYLNEQIKAIQKELGEIDGTTNEYDILKNKIQKLKVPKNIKNKALTELKRLKTMSTISAEASVIRNYIDWIIQVPWSNKSKIKKNITQAKITLDNDHYGLKKVKDRILEYLAVQSRTKKIKGPILCLVGPPGVGKTSLGKSIARSTGRKYIRMALGGIRDEAEIRGHRRTYIGALPGRIIQNMAKVGVKNPLFLLDEIDKISHDIRVDPIAALLEVLDPEQNTNFNDHYLELDYDLSHVMFIATANSTNIPAPLLDRMEIIYLSSYTEDEKFHIAKKYLKPKQIQRNALQENEIKISDNAIKDIILYYTREAGVRGLDKSIAKICRKVVKKIITHHTVKSITVNQKNLKKYLGIKKFHYGKIKKKNQIGQVNGLAWTEVGGDLLTIETACVPGKGKLIYTGSLGEVMQESIQTALTFVRSEAKKLNITKNFHEKYDIHVHMPEGATPKDGPSAGIAICTSIVSMLTNNPVRSDIAMTGEITLNGNILIIGGLKEKILAAHRGKIKHIIIPYQNKYNLEEIPKNILSNLNIHPVKKIQDVLRLSLSNKPYAI